MQIADGIGTTPGLAARKVWLCLVVAEAEESCLPVLRSVLGAVKSKWPNVTTISPLNWKAPCD